MYKDISGRTRKTIRRMPYRAIPMAQRLARSAATGKTQLRWLEAHLRISLIGTGSWEPYKDGDSTEQEDWYIADVPKGMYVGSGLATEAVWGRSIGFSLLPACLIHSIWEAKSASGPLHDDKGQLFFQYSSQFLLHCILCPQILVNELAPGTRGFLQCWCPTNFLAGPAVKGQPGSFSRLYLFLQRACNLRYSPQAVLAPVYPFLLSSRSVSCLQSRVICYFIGVKLGSWRPQLNCAASTFTKTWFMPHSLIRSLIQESGKTNNVDAFYLQGF